MTDQEEPVELIEEALWVAEQRGRREERERVLALLREGRRRVEEGGDTLGEWDRVGQEVRLGVQFLS